VIATGSSVQLPQDVSLLAAATGERSMIHPEQINLQTLNGSAVSKLNSNRNGKLAYSGRYNPCPICGRTKDQDCHWNDEVVFCHTYIDQDAGVSGYVHRGAKDI
jgi:hypothetical protein